MMLFVIVMAVGCKDSDIHFRLEYFIDEAVLLRNCPTPLPTAVTLQRFRMTCACTRMVHQFVKQFDSFLERCRLTASQFCQIFLSLLRINDVVHSQSELSHAFISSGSEKRLPFPCLISSRASSTRAKNSSLLISVEASFSFTNFLAYRVSRLISGSLSAMAPMLCQSSVLIAFHCPAVITLYYFNLLQI